LVKGFAVGRTVFGHAARAWMAGTLSDEAAINEMATRYASLCSTWESATSLSPPAIAAVG